MLRCGCSADQMGALVTLLNISLLTFCASFAAAQTVAITCFYTLPIAPGQRPAATPLVFKRSDGFEVCMRYQYKCSLNNPACLAHEAQSGIFKWHYLAASKDGCLSIAAVATRASRVRNVLCCSTNKCNVPDRSRDPATQIIQDSWLSRGTARPTTMTGTSAQVQQRRGTALGKRTGPVASGSATAATPVTAGGSLQAGGDSDGDVGNNIQLASSSPRQPTSCLHRPLPQSQAVTATTLQSGMDMCARYEYKCSLAGDTSCTALEINTNAWKWMYTPTNQENCDLLKRSPLVRNLVCCKSTNCNTIDTRLDPRSYLQTLPSTSIRSATSNNSTGYQLQQTGPALTLPGGINNSSSMVSRSNSTKDSITCYISYPTAPSQNATGGAAVYSAQFSRKRGYETCVRYSYKCSVAYDNCTPVEVRRGVWKVSYSVLSRATCAQMRIAAGNMYRNVTCCDVVNCNRPEQGTQVLPAPVLLVVA